MSFTSNLKTTYLLWKDGRKVKKLYQGEETSRGRGRNRPSFQEEGEGREESSRNCQNVLHHGQGHKSYVGINPSRESNYYRRETSNSSSSHRFFTTLLSPREGGSSWILSFLVSLRNH